MTDYSLLINKAILARENAYCPYSSFKVGASLLTKSGKIFTGCNIENSSYSSTICAERVAFFSSIAQNEREFLAIAIVGGINEIKDFVFPCGSCRQVMAEFCSQDFEIILYNGQESKTYKLYELLPNSFNKDSLK